MMQDAGHPAVITRLIHDFELSPKKGIGQNFFADPMLLDKIADQAKLTRESSVLEIGPGLGALTQRLSDRAGSVAAIEFDAELMPVLEETLSGRDNVKVYNRDFLKMNDEELAGLFGGGSFDVVSNLPYCSTTPIIQKLLLSGCAISRMTVLVQKEASERITAKPGDKQYTLTAMMTEYYTKAGILFDVPSEVFFPRPSVTSTLVSMEMKSPKPLPECGQDFLWRIAKTAIAMRRKTLLNNLKSAGFSQGTASAAFAEIGVEPSVRAETLSIYDIARLAESLYRNV